MPPVHQDGLATIHDLPVRPKPCVLGCELGEPVARAPVSALPMALAPGLARSAPHPGLPNTSQLQGRWSWGREQTGKARAEMRGWKLGPEAGS